MAAPAQPDRRGAGGLTRIVAALLAVAVLVPVGVLFTDLWSGIADRKSSAAQERHGVEYATALSHVLFALTEAQSAAVSGEAVPASDLAAAVEATAAVDERLGEALRVRERWSDLRARIELLYDTEHDDARAAYDGYHEATGLLLDLHNRVRENSGLIQDSDTDAYFLQDGAVEELPEAVVAAGRMVDLVVMAAAEPASVRDAENAEISVAQVELVSPVRDLENDLQAALESTETRSLSAGVLSLHDRFLRAMDTLLVTVPADGRVADVDTEEVVRAWDELRAAAADLLDALLSELDTLLETRIGDLTGRQRLAAGAAVVALLLALSAGWANLAGHRRPEPAAPGTGAATEPAGGGPPAEGGAPAELAGKERSGAR